MDYAQFVRRLTSPTCRTSVLDEAEFGSALTEFLAAANKLDAYKKTIFYGRADLVPAGTGIPALEHVHSDVLHGIIGIATEAGELIECLLLMLQNPAGAYADSLIEERGDLEFYAQMLDGALATTQAHIRAANMEKLMARYPERFTAERAQFRNIGAEQAALRRGLG